MFHVFLLMKVIVLIVYIDLVQNFIVTSTMHNLSHTGLFITRQGGIS